MLSQTCLNAWQQSNARKIEWRHSRFLYMCYNVIGFYNVISYGLIFYNKVCLARFASVLWKSIQINICSSHFFLLIPHINKVYKDLFNIRKEQMRLGKHTRKRHDSCELGLTSSVSREQSLLVIKKKIVNNSNFHFMIWCIRIYRKMLTSKVIIFYLSLFFHLNKYNCHFMLLCT